MFRATAIAIAALLTSATADAGRPRAVGLYSEIGIGGARPIGSASRYSALGSNFDLRAGAPIFSWLTLGGRFSTSSHLATVPAPPSGEYYQLYNLASDLRVAVQLGPIGIFAEGGLGAAVISTNVLSKVDILDPGERFAGFLSAGGGLQYQTQNRHLAFGIGSLWTVYANFDAMQTISTRLYLRYTH